MNRPLLLIVIALACPTLRLIRAEKPDGFVSLFDGKTIAGWTVPEGDNGHWKIVDGVTYGYRMDREMPAEVRAGVTPRVNADNNIGDWNTFEITMRGDRRSVKLNGQQVLQDAQLPGIPSRGRIALQHHGGKDKEGNWQSPPALVQFRNIAIEELD
ncbi:MAG: DUF1080 domain-containing protein [Planctomycetota bacterium]|nr:DUF1080 domain-containing protein [Planctomycetota bacterium]